jgi:hypothetical protein
LLCIKIVARSALSKFVSPSGLSNGCLEDFQSKSKISESKEGSLEEDLNDDMDDQTIEISIIGKSTPGILYPNAAMTYINV